MTDELLLRCLELLEGLDQLRARGGPPALARALDLAALVWPDPGQREPAARALASPHLAASMLWRTLGQGLRGNPYHPRPRDRQGGRLAADLLAFLRLHARLVADLPAHVDLPPGGLPAGGLPAGGLPAGDLQGDGGWCDLCGQCCCHAGTVPATPPGATYPAWWHHAIAGHTLYPQPFCPFLFQALGQPLFYCAIHPIKPLPCRQFDQADCERGRPGRGGRP